MDGRVFFPHSLGIFYAAMTQYLGFPYFGDEYKVMGLAPYGEAQFLEKMREIVRVQEDGTSQLNLVFFSPRQGKGGIHLGQRRAEEGHPCYI